MNSDVSGQATFMALFRLICLFRILVANEPGDISLCRTGQFLGLGTTIVAHFT